MTIISSSEVENVYFMCDEAMNQIYIFSLLEMKYMFMSYSWQKHFILFYTFKKNVIVTFDVTYEVVNV